jgi:hypothetical protein
MDLKGRAWYLLHSQAKKEGVWRVSFSKITGSSVSTYPANDFAINFVCADMDESADLVSLCCFQHDMGSHHIVPIKNGVSIHIASTLLDFIYLVNSNESPKELSTWVCAAKWNITSIFFSFSINDMKSDDVMSP